MVEKVIAVLGGSYNPSEQLDITTNLRYEKGSQSNQVTDISHLVSDQQKDSVVNILLHKVYVEHNIGLSLDWDKFQSQTNVVSELNYDGINPRDSSFYFGETTLTISTDITGSLPYYGLLPWVDTTLGDNFSHVYLYDDKLNPPEDQRYIPTLDFHFNGLDVEEMGFTADFIKPIDYDKLKTRLSPVNVAHEHPWSRTQLVDIYQQLKWGYSINNFLVGGVVKTYYPVDPEAVTPPAEPPVSTEVITFVNIVNIVKLPERTPVGFDNLQLSFDIDSVAWNVSFDVSNQASFDLIKPTKASTIELEIDINSELFNVFIGRTTTTTGVDDSGTVQRKINCKGWSVHKLLTHPYHVRRSHVETSSSTPAGLLSAELTGTGFTGTWNTASWTIPANTFTYIDKAPIAAISELTQAVGGVIIPDPDAKAFTVQPRYPVSPWSWNSVGVDINLSESNFFSIDTEWFPQESPDSVYCYGEATTGVAVKCVRAGQPGTKTLPTVVSKYFTDTIPATERGRIEVAKNGYKEIVPITTYVNPTDGIMQPLQLVQVTQIDGITTWRGMVVGVTLNLKRNGNALVQTIQLERHYDI